MSARISSLSHNPLIDIFKVDGDKSISHRSLIFSALALGKSTISGLLEGEDVLGTAAALEKMGVKITRKDNLWEVSGVGYCGLNEPDDVLDMGNSGTSARLLMGLVAPFNFTTFFTGDESLRARPMGRIFKPLAQMGVKNISRNGKLPAAIIGDDDILPVEYEMPVASAQVKSAIMLAALNILGKTTIIENEPCRDHTEIMMRHLGINVETLPLENGGRKISLAGHQEFSGTNFVIPGDISSAAFFIVAALIIPGSKITIENVGINPLRSGLIQTLQEMGGDIILKNKRQQAGEKVADISVSYSQLNGIEIPAHHAPSMIDEYPILAIAASQAQGVTKMTGLEELKVKESNRLAAIYEGLKSCGVAVKMGDDDLEVTGKSNSIIANGKKVSKIKTNLDHRIAMSFLVMGLTMKNGVEIDDYRAINTSFPSFFNIFSNLGVDFS